MFNLRSDIYASGRICSVRRYLSNLLAPGYQRLSHFAIFYGNPLVRPNKLSMSAALEGVIVILLDFWRV